MTRSGLGGVLGGRLEGKTINQEIAKRLEGVFTREKKRSTLVTLVRYARNGKDTAWSKENVVMSSIIDLG